MRFLFLTLGYHPDPVGGAWRVASEVAERLAARGHKVEVITSNPDGKLPATETRAGVQLHRFANAAGNFFLNWRRENAAARKILTERLAASPEPALVGLHHAFLGPALAGCAAPLLYVFHGPWAEEFRFAKQSRPRSVLRRAFDGLVTGQLRRTERRALRQAARIFVLSRHFESQLPRWHGAPLPPVRVISGGVNAEQFYPLPDRAAVRQELGLAPDQFLFLTMRRLDPRMGLPILIDAFARVAAAFPHAQLWLTGRGPQETALRQQIQERGLDGRVRLLGFVADAQLLKVLNAADCTVMPSLDLEGFGLATVESLACGVPVLGSRAAATPELLAPLSADLLFDSGSVDALAAKFHEVLSDPRRLPARERCRDYAVTNFSWDRPVATFETCFAELHPALTRS